MIDQGPLDPPPLERISRTYAEPLASAAVELLRRGGPQAVSLAQMTALARITAEALRQVGLRRDQVLAEVSRVLADRWLVWASRTRLGEDFRIPASEREWEQVRAYRAWVSIAEAEREQGRPAAAEHIAFSAAREREHAARAIGGVRAGEGLTAASASTTDRLAATVLHALTEGLRDAVSRRDAPCDPAAARAALRALTPAVWQWAEQWSRPDSLAS